MKKFKKQQRNYDDFDDHSVKDRTQSRKEKRLKRALQKRDIYELEDWDT